MTSTSILNQSTEEILANVGDKVKTAMLGPSTPMVPEAFAHLPVALLAGTVPIDKAAVMKALSAKSPDRIRVIAQAMREGLTDDEILSVTAFDPWFLARVFLPS